MGFLQHSVGLMSKATLVVSTGHSEHHLLYPFSRLFRMKIPKSCVITILSSLVTISGMAFAKTIPEIQSFESVELIVDLPAKNAPYGFQTVSLHTPQRSYDLRLEPNTGLITTLDAGERTRVLGEGNLFLEGKLVGVPHSWVRLARIQGIWSGGFYDGQELFFLNAKTDLHLQDREATANGLNHYILYRLRNMQSKQPIDQVTIPIQPFYQPSFDQLTAEPLLHTQANSGSLYELFLTIVTDQRYGEVQGVNRDARAAARVNFVDGIYDAQIGVRIRLKNIINLNTNMMDPNTGQPFSEPADADNMLTAFKIYMNSGPGTALARGNLTHLFTGKRLNGFAGLATLAPAGNGLLLAGGQQSYGLLTDFESTLDPEVDVVLAHEIGHNFSAPHDVQIGSDCQAMPWGYIMEPGKNGNIVFSMCSKGHMLPALNDAIMRGYIQTITIFSNGFEN